MHLEMMVGAYKRKCRTSHVLFSLKVAFKGSLYLNEDEDYALGFTIKFMNVSHKFA